MNDRSITFVIPSLGERADLLKMSVDAALQVLSSKVLVVGPRHVENQISNFLGDRVAFVDDSGATGAAEAINVALGTSLASQYFTWIGDDDQIVAEGVEASISLLNDYKEAEGTYGIVDYIDGSGAHIRTHVPPKNPSQSLRWGPQRIAQPGTVFRTSLLARVGHLDTALKCAWDQDFMARVEAVGHLRFVPSLVAKYSWHAGALTSEFLSTSMVESAEIRLARLRGGFSPIWRFVEYARIVVALLGGTKLTSKMPLSYVLKTLNSISNVKARYRNGSL